MRRDDVVRILTEHRDEIRAYGVKSLSLFGSIARDEARDDSDIDVLVEFEAEPTFDGYMDLLFWLEELLGTRVDLATNAMIRPRIRDSVNRDLLPVA
jgi:predicted nucleotidyltransferase